MSNDIDPIVVSATVDLNYSPEEGWYFEQFRENGDTRTSQTFNSKESAERTWKHGVIEFGFWQ